MVQVTRVEIEESGYQFIFIPKPREGFNSFIPFLVAVADLKSNVQDPGKDIPGAIKRRAYALAAVIFNKFKD
jgi:hypothetical protein